ncbi:MAG: hypothetical protein EZS28_022452 [Streblomastix strix]|uniref:Uncharacterized protein n=1 Tax=Streblomastix strix TaxID=222440 RepID=A0A5J4VHL3_9EUKA|nr:MAG: hypothetical protein EZS28_022452 [Streblomastix strix]
MDQDYDEMMKLIEEVGKVGIAKLDSKEGNCQQDIGEVIGEGVREDLGDINSGITNVNQFGEFYLIGYQCDEDDQDEDEMGICYF